MSNDGSVMEVSLLGSTGQVHETTHKEEDKVSNNHRVHLGVSREHITVLAYFIVYSSYV